MATIKIQQNTTALDAALNLSGSLTGFPAVLTQLPVGERVGFDALPEVWEDVDDIGQTWTPNIQGMSLDFDLTAINKGRDGVLNERAVNKAPFTTDLFGLADTIVYGQRKLKEILDPEPRVYTLGVRLAASSRENPDTFELEGGTFISGDINGVSHTWEDAPSEVEIFMPLDVTSGGSTMSFQNFKSSDGLSYEDLSLYATYDPETGGIKIGETQYADGDTIGISLKLI